MSVVIRCEGLGKQYRIGEREPYRALRDSLTELLYAPARRLRALVRGSATGVAPDKDGTFWALKDVSFEIRRGEVVGVIGCNGAGKSTLLKILSRITRPTEGQVRLRGHVGSLLEVGTGFHPELTGRDNIYLSGAILGMRKVEIDRKFDEIVAFAEVERFVDTPVKRFSSGMSVRLAFAVAAHLEPEILLVDEVLAVGDAAFQKKCLGKMGDVAKEGRTLLFVSHLMPAIQTLCGRAIWLDDGRVVEQGEVGAIVTDYLQTFIEPCVEQVWPELEMAPGNERVRLHRARAIGLEGEPLKMIDTRTPFALDFSYWNLRDGARLNLGVSLYSLEGHCVFTTTTVSEPTWHDRPFPVGLFRSVCRVPGNLLNDGTYHAVLLVMEDIANIVYCHEDVLVFEVQDSAEGRGEWYGKWPGVVRPQLTWTTEHLGPVELPGGRGSEAAGGRTAPRVPRGGR